MTSLLLWASLAVAKPLTVPVDIGVGPAAHFITGPVQADQIVHTGLVVSVQAIIDQATIRKYKKRIPKQYRDMAMKLDEVRISPSIFIPDTLFISPGIRNTGMYGVSWRPFSLSLPILQGPVRFDLNGGVRLTAFYLHSTVLESPTVFVRPGASFKAVMEVPVSKRVLFSFGWDSHLYVPQELGQFGFGPLSNSIWHIGQAFLKVHYRFPFTVNL